MITRKVGETISVRTTVKENGSVKDITGGTAKARLRGRSQNKDIDATITLTGSTGIIDADFAAPDTIDKYDFQCFLTLSTETQCVSADVFNITKSIYS